MAKKKSEVEVIEVYDDPEDEVCEGETYEGEAEVAEETEPAVEEADGELAAALRAADDYKDKWMRSVAEFDNYKKRNAKLYQEAFLDGKQDIILKVLTIGDNLERALAMELDDKTKEGVSLLLRQFNELMNSEGVTEINPAGEKFDPNVAEAVMQSEPEEGEESDTVKLVFQKGYRLGDKIIRYAKVSVVK